MRIDVDSQEGNWNYWTEKLLSRRIQFLRNEKKKKNITIKYKILYPRYGFWFYIIFYFPSEIEIVSIDYTNFLNASIFFVWKSSQFVYDT